jgi:type III restriction enzyme
LTLPYTIVPLRAANARTLIEQSIGRGLRLPYGKRTGVTPPVDRLNIIAHDKFQEIIDEANKPDSAIRLQQVVLNPDQLQQRTVTVVSQPRLETMLGIQPPGGVANAQMAGSDEPRRFQNPEEEKVAQITREVIRKLENQPQRLPSVTHLTRPEVQAEVVARVAEQYRPTQREFEGFAAPDLADIVAKTTELVVQQTIDIPRILVVPKGEVRCGFKPFSLKLDTLNYQAPSEELWIQHLRTHQLEVVGLGKGGIEEARLEDYIVSGLVDFDDIAYDDHADLLYDLAGQTVRHFRNYLSQDDTRKVLRLHQREIARFIHAQMQDHYWEAEVEHEVKISKGFTELKLSAYTASATEPLLDYRQSPNDKSNMAKYLFGGFQRCLYSVRKFQADAERKLAVILEREASKWFKPAKGQFQIYYKSGVDHLEYQPDFVAEAADCIYMLEPKAANQMKDADVLAKRDAAVTWCKQASDHAASYDGKQWKYVLIPHDAIAENMTLSGLASRFAVL